MWLLEKRKFNRMTGIQTEELFEREKIGEMEIIIEHTERMNPGVQISEH